MTPQSSIDHRKSSTRGAFTLIELLVVIAIIAILAAILFPVFAQAKSAAKKTASLSNVKNLATATQLYEGDADDTYPLSIVTVLNANGSWNHDVYWPTLLYPYVKNGEKQDGTLKDFTNSKGEVQGGGIFQSPGDGSKQINGSYIVHGRIFGGAGANALSATALDDPAGKVAIIERGVSDGQAGWFKFWSDQWFWTQGSMAPNAANEPTKAPDGRVDLIKNVGDCDNTRDLTKNGFSWQNCSHFPRYRFNRATVAAFADGHAGTFVRGETSTKLDWYKNIYLRGIDDPLY